MNVKGSIFDEIEKVNKSQLRILLVKIWDLNQNPIIHSPHCPVIWFISKSDLNLRPKSQFL